MPVKTKAEIKRPEWESWVMREIDAFGVVFTHSAIPCERKGTGARAKEWVLLLIFPDTVKAGREGRSFGIFEV